MTKWMTERINQGWTNGMNGKNEWNDKWMNILSDILTIPMKESSLLPQLRNKCRVDEHWMK